MTGRAFAMRWNESAAAEVQKRGGTERAETAERGKDIVRKNIIRLSSLLLVMAVVAISIWGPEAFSYYRDDRLLGQIHRQEVDLAGEGYRYVLSSGEKLYILSQALNSRSLPESEQSAMTRTGDGRGDGERYEELTGSYAFVIDRRGGAEREVSGQEVFGVCEREIGELKKAGVLPDTLQAVEPALYEARLCSAIDTREPRNNVSVWSLTLSDRLRNVSKEDRLIEAYIDADDGKIYGFYARIDREWEDLDPDQIILAWSRYLGLSEPEPYESADPLMEITPYFEKYVFPGGEGERTIVTIGFYEGIRELFIATSPGR